VTAADIHLEADNYELTNQQVKIDTVQDSELVNGLKDREQQLILEALKAGNGSRKYAAERLGISPRTLRYKLARMRDSGITV
ncbi:MAG: helix-turn-helix domain-containing protein, partial [Gammaproteobacteria bacterium]|nr:helix-turn-helix domain-containing protein [Gammaproteobacteria bacterium]